MLYTSDDEGATWQGPQTLVKAGAITIYPDIALAAGGGKVAVAFHGNPHDFGVKPACSGGIADILAKTYNGTAWSPLRDVSSCVGVQSNGFRTRRLAYDETTGHFSLVGEDDSGKYRLWYAQGHGATWSTPTLTPMTNLVTGAGNIYNGDYQVAAAGGTTYVAYPLITTPGKTFCCVDIFPGALRVRWTAHDPTSPSGVAYAQVQVRVDGGAWQNVVKKTTARFVVYTHATAGHTYTFRVRSRDRVNNWGGWVTATRSVT